MYMYKYCIVFSFAALFNSLSDVLLHRTNYYLWTNITLQHKIHVFFSHCVYGCVHRLASSPFVATHGWYVRDVCYRYPVPLGSKVVRRICSSRVQGYAWIVLTCLVNLNEWPFVKDTCVCLFCTDWCPSKSEHEYHQWWPFWHITFHT